MRADSTAAWTDAALDSGDIDRRVYYLQNWRADVSAIENYNGTTISRFLSAAVIFFLLAGCAVDRRYYEAKYLDVWFETNPRRFVNQVHHRDERIGDLRNAMARHFSEHAFVSASIDGRSIMAVRPLVAGGQDAGRLVLIPDWTHPDDSVTLEDADHAVLRSSLVRVVNGRLEIRRLAANAQVIPHPLEHRFGVLRIIPWPQTERLIVCSQRGVDVIADAGDHVCHLASYDVPISDIANWDLQPITTVGGFVNIDGSRTLLFFESDNRELRIDLIDGEAVAFHGSDHVWVTRAGRLVRVALSDRSQTPTQTSPNLVTFDRLSWPWQWTPQYPQEYRIEKPSERLWDVVNPATIWGKNIETWSSPARLAKENGPPS